MRTKLEEVALKIKKIGSGSKERSPLPLRPDPKTSSSPMIVKPQVGEGRDRKGSFAGDSSFDRDGDDDYGDGDDDEPERMKSSQPSKS